MILRVLERGPLNGAAIADRIEELSKQNLAMLPTAVYTALYKLHRHGFVETESWGNSPHNRKAHFYRITPEGRKQLERDTRTFQKLVRGIRLVIRTA